ncbi:MAG: ywaD, partial [Bacteroidetes bacterium]|nr:ywaD [Bacteroidota bacterium]
FDNVGLVINIEARGIKGPALLFETSPGNDRLTGLYSLAKYPYSYSLTSFVYSLLPNDTDFSVVKNDLAGLNFSVIDNLDYYHTNRDNYENISAGSVQHYGSQIEPIVHEYLTNPLYKNSSYLKGSSDNVFFTAPLFGLIIFSKNQYLVFNIVVFLLAYLIMRIYMVKGKCGASQIMKAIAINILSLVSFSAIALGISYLLAYLNGTSYSLLRMSQIEYDGEIIVLFIIFMAMVNYIVMRKFSRKIRREEFIFGSLILNLILAGVLYAYSGENFFLTVPAFLALISLFLNVKGKFAFANLVMAVLIIFVTAPFVYTLAVALTVGSLAVYSFIAALSLNLILPLADSYSRKVVL